MVTQNVLPKLLTVEEVAEALRKTRKAIYAMVERGQLPGAFKLGGCLRVRQDVLLQWLEEKGAPSPERMRR